MKSKSLLMKPDFTRRAVLLAPLACLNSIPAHAISQIFRLNNGEVLLPQPWICDTFSLADPTLLGSGGSGAVFSMSTEADEKVAVKVSWANAASSVINEGKVLRALNKAGVEGVEQLRGSCMLPGNRVVLVLSPLVERPIERIEALPSSGQMRAVEGLASTLVQMLAARVATTDVQLLADGSSGVSLLIDLSEASILGSEELSELDIALASSFVAEVDALVPSTGALRQTFLARVMRAMRTSPPCAELAEVLTGGLGL